MISWTEQKIEFILKWLAFDLSGYASTEILKQISEWFHFKGVKI